MLYTLKQKNRQKRISDRKSVTRRCLLQLADSSAKIRASSGPDCGMEIRVQGTRLSPEGRLIIEAKFQQVFQIHLGDIVHDVPGGIQVKVHHPKCVAI